MAEFKDMKSNNPVWPFTAQLDKWGYLNNKWWSTQADAQAFCAKLGLPLDLIDRHFPCGHWHKPPPPIEFPVGRLLGWDSLIDLPYAFGWDEDYKQTVRVDLVSLDANAYVPIVPDNGYTWKFQVIDVCYKYVYEIFGNSENFEIFKINAKTMIVEQNAFLPAIGVGSDNVSGGCADNEYLFLSNTMNQFYTINSDLSNLVVSVADDFGGDYGGARGLKLDINTNTLYALGGGGTKEFSAIDFHIINIYSEAGVGLFPGGNTWEVGEQFTPDGYVFGMIGYHPFDPRCYWAKKVSYAEYSLADNPRWDDWTDSAMYVTCGNFFGYTSSYQYLQRLDLGGGVTNTFVRGTSGNPIDFQGTEVACNKVSGYPVTKDINPPFNDLLAPPHTYLSKFSSSCDLEVFRHIIKGFSVPASLEEPQVWTMERSF